MTDRAVVDEVVAKVKAQFSRIDVLVNNAGIKQEVRLQKMTSAEFLVQQSPPAVADEAKVATPCPRHPISTPMFLHWLRSLSAPIRQMH